MWDFGPQIAIVDDRRKEIQSIETLLDSYNIGYRYFNADPAEAIYPKAPIETIELIFLDLYYSTGFNSEFDPYLCAQWIDMIVPTNKMYYLVVWSRDSDKTSRLLEVLHEIEKPPIWTDTRQKSDYQSDESGYNAEKLLADIEGVMRTNIRKQIDEFYGEILAIEEDHVLVNCLLDKSRPAFQIRRFDLSPFRDIIQLTQGAFVLIRVTTRPGSRTFEFLNEPKDLSDLFRRENIFKGVEDTPFFKPSK